VTARTKALCALYGRQFQYRPGLAAPILLTPIPYAITLPATQLGHTIHFGHGRPRFVASRTTILPGRPCASLPSVGRRTFFFPGSPGLRLRTAVPSVTYPRLGYLREEAGGIERRPRPPAPTPALPRKRGRERHGRRCARNGTGAQRAPLCGVPGAIRQRRRTGWPRGEAGHAPGSQRASGAEAVGRSAR